MAIFTSGSSFTNLGYKIQFKPASIRPPLPASAPPFSDPRGILTPGMVPGRNISYRIYQEAVVSPQSGIGDILASSPFGLGLFSALPSVSISQVHTRASVILFQGHDVIDLPTDGLATDGDALVLPQNVFRGLHAGATPFIGPNDNIALKSAISYGFKTPDNVLVGTKLSLNPPVDVKKAYSGFLVDTGSNELIVKGSPSFVSYVAIDTPIFRDVVTMRAGVLAIGIDSPTGGFLISDTSFDEQVVAEVMRFVYVNVQKDPTMPPDLRWRLSESYGAKTTGKVAETPTSLFSGLSRSDLAKANLAESNKHYVYNLSDDSPDTTEDLLCIPSKDAVSPLLAKAKADPSSPFFDKEFVSKSFDFKIGFAESGTQTEEISAGPSNNGAIVIAAFDYSSPNYLVQMDSTTRLGLEYSVQTTQGFGFGGNSVILLAETVASQAGLAATYDEDLGVTSVFDVSSAGSTPFLVRRTFDDSLWVSTQIAPPQSKLKAFLVGEVPYETDGAAMLLPPPSEISAAKVSGDKVTLPGTAFVTTILVAPSGTTGSSLTLYEGAASATQDPTYEYATPFSPGENIQNPVTAIATPPLSFQGIASTGLEVKSVFGFNQGDTILGAMNGDKGSSDPSEFQMANLEALKFPFNPNNVSAAESSDGAVLVAIENSSRIDVGFRQGYLAQLSMVRDVVLRISDDFETSSKKGSSDASSLPPASLPFLVRDDQTSEWMLFYVYKSKLLMKRIPDAVVDGSAMGLPIDGDTTRFSVDSEKAVAKQMHSLGATLVYDGVSLKPSGTGIVVDLDFKAITVLSNDAATANVTTPTKIRPITQYSAFMDSSGLMFVFIQTDDRITVMRSGDYGQRWADILPESFSFVPPNPKTPSTDSAAPREDGAAPSCLYDPMSNDVLLFFFFQSCLMLTRFPCETLKLDDQAQMAASMNLIKPVVLVGAVTDDLLQRGITAAPSVNDLQGTAPPILSPHRVAAVRTSRGYHRVFYKDDKSRLRSLISADGTGSGDSWVTENQFLGTASLTPAAQGV